MYQDRMYCLSCKRVFIDTWRFHDTRTDNVITNCPHCMSMNTINTNVIDKLVKDGFIPKTIVKIYGKDIKRKVKEFNKRYVYKRKDDIFLPKWFIKRLDNENKKNKAR